MPSLRVMFDNQEIDRRDLTGPVVMGRAPDCDLAVRDILLSRRHCRIEPMADGWLVADLSSKNGTSLNASPVTGPVRLADGDALSLGRVVVHFSSDSLAEAGLTPLHAPPVSPRPADPTETLSGTFMGFQYLEPGQSESSADDKPLPRPEPKPPAAYEREDIYSLLTAIASSSWDSIYEQARRPAQPRMEMNMDVKSRRRPRPLSPMEGSPLEASPADSAVQAAPPPFWRRPPAKQRLRVMAMATLFVALLIFKGAFAPTPGLAAPPVASAHSMISSSSSVSSVPAIVHAPRPQLDGSAVVGQVVAAALPILL